MKWEMTGFQNPLGSQDMFQGTIIMMPLRRNIFITQIILGMEDMGLEAAIPRTIDPCKYLFQVRQRAVDIKLILPVCIAIPKTGSVQHSYLCHCFTARIKNAGSILVIIVAHPTALVHQAHND